MMTNDESFRMLEMARDIASETRQAIEAMQGINANKTSRDLALSLKAVLDAVGRRLDARD